ALLSNLYPTDQAKFDSALASSLASVPNGTAKTAGIALGNASAARILTLRTTDHYGDTVAYTPTNKPGDWQPTGTAQKPAAFTQMPYVTPFGLLSPPQSRGKISAPPALSSQAVADAGRQ